MTSYTHWSAGCEIGETKGILRLSIRIADGGDTEALQLASSLSDCTSLEHVSISACIEYLGQLVPFLDALLCATSLVSLHLRVSSNVRDAPPTCMGPLSRFLEARGRLEFLGVQFDHCWQDSAVEAVCSVLSRNKLVLEGLLIGPHVGMHGFKTIKEMVGCNAHLQHLHIQCSRAGIAGEILMQGVLLNCSLKNLSFSENIFQSDDSIDLLARVLHGHPQLEGLYMDCDGMSTSNACTLAGALRNSRLKRVFITRDNTSYVSGTLLNGIKHSKTVTTIGGVFHRVGRETMVDFIRVNRSVQQIYVRSGFMNKFGWPDVLVAYRESPRLLPLQALTGDSPFQYGRIFWWCDKNRYWALADQHIGHHDAAPGPDTGYRWCSKVKAWSVSHLPPFMRPGHRVDEVKLYSDGWIYAMREHAHDHAAMQVKLYSDGWIYAMREHNWLCFPEDTQMYINSWQCGFPEWFLQKCLNSIHTHCHIPMAIAVCMGGHARLGGMSLLLDLDTAVIDIVVRGVLGLL